MHAQYAQNESSYTDRGVCVCINLRVQMNTLQYYDKIKALSELIEKVFVAYFYASVSNAYNTIVLTCELNDRKDHAKCAAG